MSSSKKQILAVAALCFAAAGVGFGAYRYLAQPHSIDEPGGMAPEITLNDLTGTPRQLSEWRGADQAGQSTHRRAPCSFIGPAGVSSMTFWCAASPLSN